MIDTFEMAQISDEKETVRLININHILMVNPFDYNYYDEQGKELPAIQGVHVVLGNYETITCYGKQAESIIRYFRSYCKNGTPRESKSGTIEQAIADIEAKYTVT